MNSTPFSIHTIQICHSIIQEAVEIFRTVILGWENQKHKIPQHALPIGHWVVTDTVMGTLLRTPGFALVQLGIWSLDPGLSMTNLLRRKIGKPPV